MADAHNREEVRAKEAPPPGHEQAQGHAHAQEHPGDRHLGDQSTTGLITGVLADLRTLLSAEMKAAKLEVKEELARAKSALIIIGMGGGLLAIGALVLVLMLVWALAEGTALPLWGSHGIVGGLLVIIGGGLVAAGMVKGRDADAWPEETVERAKEDVKWIREESRSRHAHGAAPQRADESQPRTS